MAVFISVTTNAFEEVFDSTRRGGRPVSSYTGVRRPLRGIEIKEDTYSIIKILTFIGEELPLVSSSAQNDEGRTTEYSNFIVQRINEQRIEKQQIVETFGEDFIFFFGEKPRFLDVQGVLVNTNDFNWKSEFWHNYENHLRGTKLVEANARLYMFFDDVVVEGYILQAQAQAASNTPYHLPFQFQLFVTNYAILSQVGSVFIPERRAPTEMTFTVDEANGAVPSTTDQVISSNNQAGLVNSAGGLAAGGAGAAGGGLVSFLSSVGSNGLGGTADFNIQQTLENIRNTFFGRQINVPEGIGSQFRPPPIQNRASFREGRRGVPIHNNLDEYPESAGLQPEFDNEEIQRQQQELALRDGDQLEQEARRRLEELGIDVTKRDTNALLLGRGAFAATQVVGSFGIRQADGVLNLL